MSVIETEDGLAPCPDSVAIIGGGRWARVLVEVICSLVPPLVTISVHSRRNIDSMAAWVDARGLGRRIQLSSSWPRFVPAGVGAVIVANAARDHQEAVEWALSERFPTLVEKPIALTATDAQRLANLARDQNVRLAAAHVFLFTRYLENFSKFVADAGRIESLHIDWADPGNEERYGERKRYDPGLPIFSDLLPHVVSIAGSLLPDLPSNCRRLEVRRGGAALELELMAGSIPCIVRMGRNTERRRRILQACVKGEMIKLDFSLEPGTIIRGSSTTTGDQLWDSRMRPAARMLVAFLKWAAGGERDGRLDIGAGLQACRLIDQALNEYRSALVPWLITKLATSETVDGNLRYALAELLQSQGSLPPEELDRQINTVKARFSGADGPQWLKELTHTSDAAKLLSTLVA